MMRKLISKLLPLVLVVLSTLIVGIVYAVTVTGTIYVVTNNSQKVPLNFAVHNINIYRIVVKTPEGFIVAIGLIYPNSTYVVYGLQNYKTYEFYLMNPRGQVPLYTYNVLTGTYGRKIIIPPIVQRISLNLYIMYSDLLKLLYRYPKIEYEIISKPPKTVIVGRIYNITIRLSNVGTAPGVVIIKLILDSKTVFSKRVALNVNESTIINIPLSFSTPGSHFIELFINGSSIFSEWVTAKLPPVNITYTVIEKPPSKIFASIPYYIKIKLVNTGQITGTINLALKIDGQVKYTKTITLAPSESKIITIPVIINTTGIHTVTLLINGSTILSMKVTVGRRRICIIYIPNITMMYHETKMINIYLLNCTFASGIALKLHYNSTILKIVKIIPGMFVTLTSGIPEKAIKDDLISVVIAGTVPCNMQNITIVVLKVYAKNYGSFTFSGEGTVSDINGNIYPAVIEGGHITVLKYLECDFNHNGMLDIGDVVLLLKVVLGLIKSPVPCDLNHNGMIDIGDVVLLLKKVLGIA